MVNTGDTDWLIRGGTHDGVSSMLAGAIVHERFGMFPCIGSRHHRPPLNVDVLACPINPLSIAWLQIAQSVRKKIEVHLHNLRVVVDRFTGASPIIEVACPKIGCIQVTFGFGKGKFIWHVGEPGDLHASDLQRRYVFAAVINHREALTNVLNWLAFFGVVMKQAGSGAFVSVDDEVNEASAALARCSEFD
jgi:hypothetical protein